MNDIKTRETVKDVRALDRAANIGNMMKSANVRTKEIISFTNHNDSDSPNTYAEDRAVYSAQDITQKAGHVLRRQGKHFSDKVRQKIFGRTQKSSSDHYSKTAPAGTAQYRTNNKNLSRAITRGQNLGRNNNYSAKQSQQSIRTAQHGNRISQFTAKSGAKGSIKTAERSIRTAQNTSRATIKTSQTVAKTAAKSAQLSARTAQRAAQAARVSAKATATVGKALVKATVSAIKAIAAAVKELVAAIAAGGWLAVIVIIVILLAVYVFCSVFGIFASEKGYNGTPSMPEVVRQINADFSAKIDSIIQSNPHDKVVINNAGTATMVTNWNEVLAVYAVVVSTDPQNPLEVATLDDTKIDKLKKVFWDMNCISYSIDSVQVGMNEQNHEPITQTILTISVIYKTAEGMMASYGFDENRANQVRELLKPEYAELFKRLTGSFADITLTSDQIADIMKTLPADLSEARKNVVLTAYSLLGKVNYFWGGKSLVLGWDSRWGTPMTVTADGSQSSGTIRPFGLDCSGFVDWVFYNVTGGNYIIGHGGGAESQYSFCDAIDWNSAQPGDLVFYPDCEHVGIVVRNEGGTLTVIHCASGYNNVVMTQHEEGSGFAFAGKPRLYA